MVRELAVNPTRLKMVTPKSECRRREKGPTSGICQFLPFFPPPSTLHFCFPSRNKSESISTLSSSWRGAFSQRASQRRQMDEQRNNKLVTFNKMLAIELICRCAYQLMIQRMREKANQVQRELKADCDIERDKLMYRLLHSGQCRDIVRMDARSFLNLCSLLEEKGGLKPSRRAGIHELVARFLYTVGHNGKHRPTVFYWWRGRATVSRDFHRVMRAILELEQDFVVQSDGSRTPQEILNNENYYPYFKDCVGAIDGTHVRARVHDKEAPKYRGRKDYPTMNVLAACTFDLKFTYVLVGWKGTVSNSRIIKNALTRRYPLKIPQDKDVDKAMLAEVDAEIEYRIPSRPERPTNRDEERDSRRGEVMREEMTLNMWTDYAR